MKRNYDIIYHTVVCVYFTCRVMVCLSVFREKGPLRRVTKHQLGCCGVRSHGLVLTSYLVWLTQ